MTKTKTKTKTKITQKEAKTHGILMSNLKEYNVFYKLENGDIVDEAGNIRAYGKVKNDLIDALNFIDELACACACEKGEAKKLAKAYKLLADHILENKDLPF